MSQSSPSSFPKSPQETKQIWQSVLGQIELKHSASIVNTWFNNTHLESINKSSAVISCQSPYTQDVLQKRYNKTIVECLEKSTQKKLDLEFIIQKTKEGPDSGPLFDQTPEEATIGDNFKTHEEHQHNVNPRFTFENFVVGNCNRVAHAAALAVTSDPGTAYNPLFIHGGSGMGKSHLLHAIGNHLLQNPKCDHLLCFPVETFINDFIDSIRYKKTKEFKKKYRQSDGLLIDDIQFIGGNKISTQEEFFHTFNELYSGNRQIIICSDRPPEEIDQLTKRLVTRFAGGLMVEISPPDFETRLAIIQTKAAVLGMDFNTESAEFVAQCTESSIREIEGILLKIRSETLVRELTPTLGVIKSILIDNNSTKKNKQTMTPELIFRLVNERFGTTMSQLCGRRRKSEIVIPRQIAMYLLRNDLGLNLEHIGDLLGGRDHTTVMHGTDKISSLLKKKKPLICEAVRYIRQEIY
ncbi:chromosomal replication initiator protein DnaA [Patescibacteria group bacterium]|nr:chromosomal replication initiator protein DnaA [Patescibacteria group bacterium]